MATGAGCCFPLGDYPPALFKKVTLLQHFRSHLVRKRFFVIFFYLG